MTIPSLIIISLPFYISEIATDLNIKYQHKIITFQSHHKLSTVIVILYVLLIMLAAWPILFKRHGDKIFILPKAQMLTLTLMLTLFPMLSLTLMLTLTRMLTLTLFLMLTLP